MGLGYPVGSFFYGRFQMQENQIFRYLREKEAADFISVSVQTLRNWRHRGEGPKFHKPTPKVVRYRLDQLQEFMEQK
jgi:hypothetical protein